MFVVDNSTIQLSNYKWQSSNRKEQEDLEEKVNIWKSIFSLLVKYRNNYEP